MRAHASLRAARPNGSLHVRLGLWFYNGLWFWLPWWWFVEDFYRGPPLPGETWS